jgi:gliding motility-associated lipoprotein GldH
VAQRQYCTFNLPELDSTKRYDLFINVRDNNDYQFNNLFFNCGVGITKWIYKVDTLEYQMAEPDGTLLGNGFQT